MKYLALVFLAYLPLGWSTQCPVDRLAKYTWHTPQKSKAITVNADSAKMLPESIQLSGNVRARRGKELFVGDSVNFNRETEVVSSKTPMFYGKPDIAVQSQQSQYSLQTSKGKFQGVRYYLSEKKANGDADSATVDTERNVEELVNATYSTCPRLKKAWSLKAKKLVLDHNSNIGEAWHTTFRISDVPVFYFPYMNFPLDGARKSGFLLPRINLSDSRGVDISVPYYFNIAPNQDATLSPRLMTKRGLMLEGKYRYLFEDFHGTVAGSYLHNDKKTGEKRWSFDTTHTYRPNDRLYITSRYQRVSDKSYLGDFSRKIDAVDDGFYLKSFVKGVYKLSPHVTLSAEVTDYQVANIKKTEADKPYRLLPRLTAKGNWRFGDGLLLNTETELVRFDKKHAVSGWRADQLVKLSYPMRRSYGFIKPTAEHRFTRYRLKNQPSGQATNLSRSVPTFSVDAGLFFDRNISWFGSSAVQSLEPRLFYLYTPYRDQSKFPEFDTSKASLSYNSMFLTDRFNGRDRVGDANQLTTAVSSKIVSQETGRELAKLSIGQIQYFADRRVTLNKQVGKASRSNIVAEASATLYDSLKVRASTHYDTNTKHAERSSVGLTYAPAPDKSVSISHLYDDDNYKQVNLSGVWRFNDQWRAFWRWNYSIEQQRTSDSLAGVEYADCCWGVRLLARRYRDNLKSDIKPETTFFIEFVLNGLGNVGSDTSSMLRNSIPNYRPINYEAP